jgi:hypothetical protein
MMNLPLLFWDVEYVGRRRFLPVLLLMLGIFKDEYYFLLFSISGEGEKCPEKEKNPELGLEKKILLPPSRVSPGQ